MNKFHDFIVDTLHLIHVHRGLRLILAIDETIKCKGNLTFKNGVSFLPC